MLLDQPAVDVGAVGAVEVLKERVIEDIDNQGMVSADRGVIDPNVIVLETANRVPLLGHVVLGENLPVEA